MNKLQRIGREPCLIIEWPMWLLQFFAGLFILSPLWNPNPNSANAGNASVVAEAAGSTPALMAYGIIIATVGILGLLGLMLKRPWGPKARRVAAFTTFIIFFYFVVLRLLIFGPTNLSWISYFLNACAAAAIYLRLKWLND